MPANTQVVIIPEDRRYTQFLAATRQEKDQTVYA
jgi:hypothetical protein